MLNTLSVLLCAAVFASVILTASAISCYQCNSAEFPQCHQLDVRRPDLIARFYQQCNGDYNGSIPFCRKTDLTVVEGDLQRTIRSCGWVKRNEQTSCYKADNDDHLETVCQCFTDGCNAAPGAHEAVVATTLTLAAATWLTGCRLWA